MTLEELIARLEAATGPSRELDVSISVAVGREYETTLMRYTNGTEKRVPTSRNPFGGQVDSPRYTSSIDAALTLLPEGWCPLVGQNVHHRNWTGLVQRVAGAGDIESHHTSAPAPTHAIAICIAALKARAAT